MSTKTFLEESYKGWKLVRRSHVQTDELELLKERCARCDLCLLVCPREALSFQNDENDARKDLTVDLKECSFCGYCVAFCPFHALELRINKKPEIPIVEQGVFFPLIRHGQVEMSPEDAALKCPSCYICVQHCYQRAISLKFVNGIPHLQIDYHKCAGCRSCSVNCPVGIIKTNPAFTGSVELDLEQAKQFSKEVVEICPMGCFVSNDDGELSFSDEACVFCGACQHIPGAPSDMIVVKRATMRTLSDYSAIVTDEIKKSFLSS